MTVEYRPIPGFPGYRVGDDGSVWSDRLGTARPVRTRLRAGGYPYLSVYRNGTRGSFTVHRVVMLAFRGPRPSGMQVCHGDGNKLNNQLSNLRYDTAIANERDKALHGTGLLGSRTNSAKLNEQDAAEIFRRAHEGERTSRLAREYGVHRDTVRRIRNGRYWAHVTSARTTNH